MRLNGSLGQVSFSCEMEWPNGVCGRKMLEEEIWSIMGGISIEAVTPMCLS